MTEAAVHHLPDRDVMLENLPDPTHPGEMVRVLTIDAIHRFNATQRESGERILRVAHVLRRLTWQVGDPAISGGLYPPPKGTEVQWRPYGIRADALMDIAESVMHSVPRPAGIGETGASDFLAYTNRALGQPQ